MAPRITEEKIKAAKVLLDAGAPQRTTACLVGISRATVRRIIKDDASLRRPKKLTGRRRRIRAERCPGCGAMVRGDCLACRITSSKERDRDAADE